VLGKLSSAGSAQRMAARSLDGNRSIAVTSTRLLAWS
jgi:hypothetical protein